MSVAGVSGRNMCEKKVRSRMRCLFLRSSGGVLRCASMEAILCGDGPKSIVMNLRGFNSTHNCSCCLTKAPAGYVPASQTYLDSLCVVVCGLQLSPPTLASTNVGSRSLERISAVGVD